MKAYQEKLKVTRTVLRLCALVLILCYLWPIAAEFHGFPFPLPQADTRWQSLWRGFISGASFAMLVFVIVGLVQIRRAFRDEAKMKALYVRQNDERSHAIDTSAKAAAMVTFLLGGLVAVIVAGYFSMTVSLTILVCVLTVSLLKGVFVLYYSKKF